MSAAGNDYAELCDLGLSRWSSRGIHTSGSSSLARHHLRSRNFEADDLRDAINIPSNPALNGPYGINTRIGNSTNSLRAERSGYPFVSGAVHTLVDRPHSPHYYFNTAGAPLKGGSLPGRGSATYMQSHPTSHLSNMDNVLHVPPGSMTNSLRPSSDPKKRPISPEQVIRMFGATTSSSSVPTNYHYSNGTKDFTERRSPASSPPSTTHQMYRGRSVPGIHELSTRTVTMSRDQQLDANHGFGICVKGGRDTGVGVYISRIEENSVAERAGLRPGDTILEVNGTPFTSLNHEEALKKCVQILKSSRQISMTVRAPTTLSSSAPLHGFGPPPHDPMYSTMPPLIPQPQPSIMPSMSGGIPFRQTCSWMDRHGRPVSPPTEYDSRRTSRRDRRVELVIEPGQSLGLMIRGGVEYGLGIFVTGVDKDSVADRAGLVVGDEIIEVNGQSFLDVTHDEAVSQLKYHKRMSLLIRDVGKVPHSCTSIEMEPWDVYSATGTRARRKGHITTMVEEKARSLLPRHQFASLSYYITEYGAKAMTIDAFVSVLLEMLDTYEKHTLVTEIRELIFPEDRTRYDELVYQRDRDLHHLERHRRTTECSRDLPVTDTDMEVMAANGKSPSSDSGLGMTVSDLKTRQKSQLPYRPLSAGPILHGTHYHQPCPHQHPHHNHHSSLRHLGGSQKRLTPTKTVSIKNTRNSDPAGVEFSDSNDNQEYDCEERHTRRGSETKIPRSEYEHDVEQGGYLDGLRSHLGGLTQRVKSWYWGRPLELASKLSRSFDSKDETSALLNDKNVRRHQSMQRLSTEQNNSMTDHNHEHNPNVVPDNRGNLLVTVKKTKPILGIAIEGGANTKHPLPRIINIHENGAAYEAGGLEVGQLILQVDDNKVEGLHHQEVARLIAECFSNRDKAEITFLVVEAKKSNLEPKPTALIFLEA